MYTINGTVWYPFCLVWSNVSCFRDELVISHRSVIILVAKSQPYLDSFKNTYSKMKTNIQYKCTRKFSRLKQTHIVVESSITDKNNITILFHHLYILYQFANHAVVFVTCAHRRIALHVEDSECTCCFACCGWLPLKCYWVWQTWFVLYAEVMKCMSSSRSVWHAEGVS